MAALTTEQLAVIAKRKEIRDLGETFQKVFSKASNCRDEQVFVELFVMFTKKPEMADLVVLMAKEYEKLGRIVDLRMKAGHDYLLEIANDNQTLLDDNSIYTSSEKLDSIKVLLDYSEDQESMFEPLMGLTKEQQSDDEVVKLLALSFTRNHPTLQQSFLGSLRMAAQYAIFVGGIKDSVSLRKIASYDKALPFI